MLSSHKGTRSRSYTKTGFVDLRVLVSWWRALLNSKSTMTRAQRWLSARSVTRTEVTIETDEVWVIKRSASGFVVWCPQCGELVSMVTPDEAAILTSLDTRVIYRQVETGLIHYAEMPGGSLLVCFNSIIQLDQKSKQT
jgi:hypothetical protein